MCRGLYDSPEGLDRTEISEPEDCGIHALPQGAEFWTKGSGIVSPPTKEGYVWQRPTFVDGELRFPDGQAAADAAVVALSASATAAKLVAIATVSSMIKSPPVAKPIPRQARRY